MKCGRESEKCYRVLFVCTTTRAVHIEMGHSLETDAQKWQRKGWCQGGGDPLIFGLTTERTFVGAEREIKEALKRLNLERIDDEVSQHWMLWHLNPPAAPHFGSVWEKLVKPAKGL